MSDNIRTLLESVREAIDAYLAAEGDGETAAAPEKKTRATKSRAKAKADPEPEENEDDADGEEDVEAELRKMTVAALRKRAIALGFDKDDVKDADKDDLVDAILEDIAETTSDDADSESEESEEESEDDADEERRAELEGMTLAALKKLAREEPTSAKPNEIRTMDKEALVDLILDAEGDDDSDSAMDGEEGDDDGYTKDELQAMDAAELKTIIEEWGLDMPAKKVKPALIKAILDAQ